MDYVQLTHLLYRKILHFYVYYIIGQIDRKVKMIMDRMHCQLLVGKREAVNNLLKGGRMNE